MSTYLHKQDKKKKTLKKEQNAIFFFRRAELCVQSQSNKTLFDWLYFSLPNLIQHLFTCIRVSFVTAKKEKEWSLSMAHASHSFKPNSKQENKTKVMLKFIEWLQM